MFTDSLPTHVVAGLGAGFLAVCVGSPVDVVKSRMMGAPPPRISQVCSVAVWYPSQRAGLPAALDNVLRCVRNSVLG